MELQHLKDIAAKLNFTHHHMIGAEKLAKDLTEHCLEIGTTLEEVSKSIKVQESTDTTTTTTTTEPTPDEVFIAKLASMSFTEVEQGLAKNTSSERQKEAMRLIRCTISCNNKNKSQLTGEIFCARNKVISEVKKFVPFNVPYHIPLILFNMIKEKEYQTFRTEKLPNGSTYKKTVLVPEYNVQELPPITQDELTAIAQKQLAEGFNGE